jgi:sortase B
VGWLTVPHTGIDYPFVQAADNSAYLDRNINGKKSASGAIFMDYWNHSDFSDFNTVLYGHNMKSGSMFASLKRFADSDFFDANRSGTIWLLNQSYSIEFFAYLVVSAGDDTVYRQTADSGAALDYMRYIRENARQYREPYMGEADRIVTLSTCAREFRDSRMVLLGKLIPAPIT